MKESHEKPGIGEVNQKLFENFFEIAIDLLCTVNTLGDFLHTNPAWEKILGYSKEDLRGKKFIDFVHPEDMDSTLSTMEYLLRGKDVINFVNRYRTKNGQYIFLNWRGTIRDHIIYAIARDVTHEKESESILASTRAQLDSVLNSQKEMICRFLPDTTLTFVNSAYCRAFGKYKHELLGKKFIEFVPETSRVKVMEHIKRLSLTKESIEYQHEVILSDGKKAWQEWTDYIIIEDDLGNPLEFQSVGMDITQRRKSEEELARIYHLLKDAQKISRLGVWELDLKNEDFVSSEEVHNLLELPESFHFTLQNCLDFFHPEYRPLLKATFEDIKKNYRPFDLISKVITSQYKERWVRISGKPELINDNISKIIGFIQDISDMKEVELNLKSAKEQLSSFFDEIPDVVWSVRYPDFEVLLASPSLQNLFGFSPEKWDKNYFFWKNVVHPEDKHYLETHLQKLRNQGYSKDEYRIVDKEGTVKWVASKAKLIRDQTGQITRIDGYISDISAQKQLEMRLLRDKRLLGALTSSTAELLSNPDVTEAIQASLLLIGNALDAEQSYFFTVHYDKDSFTCSHRFECYADGRPINIRDPELQNVPLEPFIAEKLLSDQPFQLQSKDIPDDLVMKKYIKKQNILSLIMIPIFYHGKTAGFVGFDQLKQERVWSENEVNLLLSFSDNIANAMQRNELDKQLIQEKERAEEASRAKSAFLASMSHEIRTPLNSVIGFSDLLSMTDMSQEQLKYIQAIHNSGKLLLEIINDILDFSKIEAGKMELFPEKINIEEAIEQIADMVRFKTNEKKIKLTMDVHPNIPRFIYVDGMRIRQILVNLLSNSVKFTEKGEIIVSLVCLQIYTNGHAKLRFSVRDTGIGIPLEKQKKVFEAFTQADNSTTRKYGGTGLGLAICNRLLYLMNSNLEIESKEGEGSHFYFDIIVPIENGTDKQIALEEDSEEEKPISEDPTQILIVDDNPVNVLLAKSMILKMFPNALIFEAEDGEQAIELFEVNKPDLVLLDIQMPILSGYDTAQEIRKRQISHVPIIALTAEATAGERDRCIRAGMDDYLAKPFVYNNLRAKIKKCIFK